MKKEIQPDVYEATLEFLEDRVKVYSMFFSAAEKEAHKERYGVCRDDCADILYFFTEAFKPRKRTRRKKSAEGV